MLAENTDVFLPNVPLKTKLLFYPLHVRSPYGCINNCLTTMFPFFLQDSNYNTDDSGGISATPPGPSSSSPNRSDTTECEVTNVTTTKWDNSRIHELRTPPKSQRHCGPNDIKIIHF